MLCFPFFIRILSTIELARNSLDSDVSRIVSIIDELENIYDSCLKETANCDQHSSIHHPLAIGNNEKAVMTEDNNFLTKENSINPSNITDFKDRPFQLDEINNFDKANSTAQTNQETHNLMTNSFSTGLINNTNKTYISELSNEVVPYSMEFNLFQGNSVTCKDDFLSEIDYNDLYFANKTSNNSNSISVTPGILNMEKDDFNTLLGNNILITEIDNRRKNSQYSASSSKINAKENDVSVIRTVGKYLNSLKTFLNLDGIKDDKFKGKIEKAYYLNKLKKSKGENFRRNEFFLSCIEKEFDNFYKIIRHFDIKTSCNYNSAKKSNPKLHIETILRNSSNEIFLKCLKRNNTVICNKNIYLYLTDEVKNIVKILPYSIIRNIFYLKEITKQIEKINCKRNEFTELNTIYSLIKFQKSERYDKTIIYFFIKALNMILDDDIKDKEDRIYICYNYIFLILNKFSSKLRKISTDEEMTNSYLNMFIISSDVLWGPRRNSLYEALKSNITDTLESVFANKNLLSHLFFSLEIIFVNKVLDDNEVDDLNVRYECRDMLKKKIQKYFDKFNSINKCLLMNTCEALHQYIIKKDFSLLDKLENKRYDLFLYSL